MSDALIVSNLICRYNDQPVVNDLSFNVEKGEIVCLLGSSGCGKTTLLKAIAGLLPLEGGSMKINGRKIVDTHINVPPEQRKIGMIFQDYALFPHLTVAGNVAFGITSWGTSKIKTRVKEMLTLVKLEGLDSRYPHQLSGGQQQRVAIARALACKPDLLLLDEPFSNIDTQVRYSLIKEIRKMFKQQDVTAIFVTHSREEAFAFADKLAVMNQGVIEQYGSATDLYYYPYSRFVADFLGHGSYIPISGNDNQKMTTPLGNWPIEKKVNGHALEWLIRPQYVSIFPDEAGEGKICDVQFMGDSCRYWVEINGQILMVYSNQLLEKGDRVQLDIRPHPPVLFSVN
ncbi:ABC transporter ATP-binding protein [Candidatus Enterovibrio escicola]|uniref:Ferric iron ABC transporter, ATP-binding protein n=1 Tax=Candidatus Enterovibrio escicola TaxID=1927127 RepID=A0A2A5T1M6_9GAMM|nr:ABC transporter ATP-binding protein [Candidatus Enterovibrio escacola]PCS22063.1 Ferric iron ABC transporter, ATP-binding protein [Candidatus Enterovibrio escacola]